MKTLDNDDSNQLLPISNIESIVTISNGNKEPLVSAESQNHGRFWSDFDWYRHQPSVSMITIPFGGKDVSMVATSDGRISLATYTSDRNAKKRGTVQMKYTEKGGVQYKAVCLVPKEDSAALLAIDTTGQLHCCNLLLEDSEVKRRILDLRECDLSGNSEHLVFMNNLTSRQEIRSRDNDSQKQSTQSSTQCNISQTPTKKKQKRKRGDPLIIKKNCSPVKADPDASSLPSHGLYVVASCLNSPMPSDAAPIIMYISNNNASKTNEWECSSSITIPMDHTCGQMKCIAFLSRESCGALWDSVASVVMKDEDVDAECDSGLVLMGFQDGSLRAVIVYKQSSRNSEADVTIQTSRIATLLAGCGQAPLLSIELISPPSGCKNGSPLLVCCRENSSVILISSTFIHQQPFQCEYRVVSMNLLRYDSSSVAALTFLGVYDTGGSFLLRAAFTMKSGSVQDWKSERIKLSLLSGQSVSTPPVQYTDSESDYLFVIPQSNGKVTFFKLILNSGSRHESQSSSEDVKSPILAHLWKSNSLGKLMIQGPHKSASVHQLSKHESLMKKLQSSTSVNNNTSVANTANIAVAPEAMREIRDATRVSSYIMANFARRGDLAPWRLEDGKITVDEDSLVKLNMNSWNLATHVIHLHPDFSMSDPVCYRIAGGGCGCTKVLYGGTVRSTAAAARKSTSNQSAEIRVTEISTATITCASVQKTYDYSSKTWYQSKSIIDSQNEVAAAAAYTCSSVIHLSSV